MLLQMQNWKIEVKPLTRHIDSSWFAEELKQMEQGILQNLKPAYV